MIGQGHLDAVATEVLAGLEATATPPSGIAINVVYRGSATGVARGDRQRLAGARPLDGSAAGTLRRLDPPLPMSATTQLDAASLTKLIGTTAAIMRLVDQGALSLDDSVASYVPAFVGTAKSTVTIEDLLLHRGGLHPWWPLYCQVRTSDEGVALAADLPLAVAPRTVRTYSDLGFVLLGRVVAEASGLDLAEAVRLLVLEPLAMAHTAYAHPVDPGGEVAAGSIGDSVEFRMIETGDPYPVPHTVADFDGWREQVLVGQVNDGNSFHVFGGCSGHAGLFTTVDDLSRFGAAVLSSLRGAGGWQQSTVQRFIAAGPDAEQAMGFRRTSVLIGGRTIDIVGHPGFTGSWLGIIPGLDTTIVVTTNRLHVDGQPTSHTTMWQHVVARVVPLLVESRRRGS